MTDTMALVNDEVDAGAAAPKASEGMGGLAKGLAVVEAFGAAARLTVADAARAAGISRPAARRCLLTLLELGYVEYDGKFFKPLPRMLRLGSAYLSTTTLPQLAQPLLVAARDVLNESVSLAVFDEGWSVFIARAEALRIVSTGARIGARHPAFCSATGRVLLSRFDEAAARAYLAKVPPARRTPKTLHAVEEVLVAVRRAAADGYAVSDEEIELGLRAIAVPVRDGQGQVVAALSASVSSARVSVEEMLRDFLPVLADYAKKLGWKL